MRYSLNFGVPTEPEASELPKGLALGRDGNIHIRITPLGDVGSHKHYACMVDLLGRSGSLVEALEFI